MACAMRSIPWRAGGEAGAMTAPRGESRPTELRPRRRHRRWHWGGRVTVFRHRLRPALPRGAADAAGGARRRHRDAGAARAATRGPGTGRGPAALDGAGAATTERSASRLVGSVAVAHGLLDDARRRQV